MELVRLFNDAANDSNFRASDAIMIMYNALERVWEKGVVTKFKILPWNFPVGLRKDTRNLRKDKNCPDRDSN
jgi:hypothetical protein